MTNKRATDEEKEKMITALKEIFQKMTPEKINALCGYGADPTYFSGTTEDGSEIFGNVKIKTYRRDKTEIGRISISVEIKTA